MSSTHCPITQEEIGTAIELRGVRFELGAILGLLTVQRSATTHPYERTPFTDAELAHIHFQALLHCTPTLLHNGWLLQSSFLRDLRVVRRKRPFVFMLTELDDHNVAHTVIRTRNDSTVMDCTCHEMTVGGVLCLFTVMIAWIAAVCVA